MECTAFRETILKAAEPNRLSPALREHAAGCAKCQAWHRSVVRLDGELRLLPLPAARPGAKQKVLNLLELAPLSGADILPARQPASPSRRKLFAGLAASVALVGGAWFFGGTSHRAVAALPADPLLEMVVRCNVTLAGSSTATAETKLNELVKLANQLSIQMNDMALVDRQGSNLKCLAELYRDVVLRGLVEQARGLDAGQRLVTLQNLRISLNQTNAEASVKAGEVPPVAVEAFKQLAQSAKEGAERIHAMLAEQSS